MTAKIARENKFCCRIIFLTDEDLLDFISHVKMYYSHLHLEYLCEK